MVPSKRKSEGLARCGKGHDGVIHVGGVYAKL